MIQVSFCFRNDLTLKEPCLDLLMEPSCVQTLVTLATVSVDVLNAEVDYKAQ